MLRPSDSSCLLHHWAEQSAEQLAAAFDACRRGARNAVKPHTAMATKGQLCVSSNVQTIELSDIILLTSSASPCETAAISNNCRAIECDILLTLLELQI